MSGPAGPGRKTVAPVSRQERVYFYAEIAFWVAAVAAVVTIISLLAEVLWPLFVAAAIAYVLDPVADRLEARGLSRERAILVIVLVALGAGALLAGLLVPLVAHEGARFAKKAPQYLEIARPWLHKLPLSLPSSLETLRQTLAQHGDAADLAQRLWKEGAFLLGGAARGAAGFVRLGLGLALVPFFSYYCLRDWDRFTARVHDLIPRHRRDAVAGTFREIDRVLASWARGQLVVMAIEGAIYALALSLIGVPSGVVLGVLAGALAFIPYAGVALAFLITVLQCLLEWQGAWQLGAVAVIFTGMQVLDGLVIAPRVIGERLGMSPLSVITAVLIGSKVAGFVGVLLAVPAAATFWVLFQRGVFAYKHSEFYGEHTDGASDSS